MESFDEFDVDCDKESLLENPYTDDWDCDTFVASMKEDSSSDSSSSWNLDSIGEGLSECFKLKEDHFDLEQQNEYGSYDELLKKFIEKEEKLRVSNYKLEQCEEEVIKLKIQIEQSEGQLNDVQKESKLKKIDLEQCEHQLEVANEKLKISGNEIEKLTKELQVQLKVAEECVAKVDSERKQIQDQENMITWYKNYGTKLELEMQKFKNEIVDMQAKFSMKKDEMHSDIVSLSAKNSDLISRLKEWEKCEAANLELKELHAAQKMALYGEINSLKEEVRKRKDDVEAVNKEFDMHKQKLNILVTEREDANAKIDILQAEIISQEDIFKKLKSKASNRLNLVEELALKVDELEREVARQNGVISNMEREKNELCLSVEHYKTKYEKLFGKSFFF